MKQKHMNYAIKEKTSHTYGWQKIFNSVLVGCNSDWKLALNRFAIMFPKYFSEKLIT